MKFLFDCDDTLYDLSWPFRKAVEKCKLPCPASLLDEFYAYYRKCGDEIFDLVQNHQITIDESGIRRLMMACRKYSMPMDRDKASFFQDTYRSFQNQIQIHPVLFDYLKNTDTEIAVLTNGQDAHQRMKLKALRVYDLMPENHTFTSAQLEYAKPDIRAFHAVMERLGSTSEQWAYIGDHYSNDCIGSKNAGMTSIHFNRHHHASGELADYVVYDEKELVELLKNLERV